MIPEISENKPSRFLIPLAAFVIVIGGMHAAASLLNPILLSVFIAIVAMPLLDWLIERSVPSQAAVLIVMAGIIGICLFLIWVLSVSLSQAVEALPAYEEMLRVQVEALKSMLEGLGISAEGGDLPGIVSTHSILPSIVTLISGLIQSIMDLLLVLVITNFLLFEFATLSGTERPVPLRTYTEHLITYIIVRIKTNILTGIGAGIFLAVIGVDFAVLWGALIAILSFIPYAGLWIAALPAIGLAWLEGGLTGAVLALIGIVGSNFIAEELIFPAMAGEDLQISPVVVIIALFFWTWVLGVPGLFLAIPLTIAGKMLLESYEETRWITRLMEGASAFSR
ncbi:AI-2E family transporter [Methanofollis fontis]|uniref:AI-2E family transporter n=1 Tax=Methanofollis fontis TaxID=2052832 RepID=A0A483CV02_9EURY|nr:AI-2E family transporter [Methanofollis fontis]TAJ45466.1 hypothetical protein CUJ86_01670 [Methanofollis fontis]